LDATHQDKTLIKIQALARLADYNTITLQKSRSGDYMY